MKYLLINPPFYRFQGLDQSYVPLSLLSVGSKLSQDGHEVIIKNMEVSNNNVYEGYTDRQNNYERYLNGIKNLNNDVWNELRKIIGEIKPDKIGINVLNVKYKSALNVIKIAEEFKIPVIVGGNHPTINHNVYPSNIEVFKGEFESNGQRVQNLDELPMPNYDILYDKYPSEGYSHIMSARGCPFKCSFCSSNLMWNRKVTFKSVDRIIKEMKYVEDRFHSDYFTFWDETFTLNKNRLTEFCSKYNLSSKWRCDTRADHVSDKIVKMMKNAGCGQMSLGIESGVNRILEYIDKGETIDTFKQAADILNNNNILWKAYAIIGFPEETEEDILETVKFIKGLNPFRITLSFFTPYQGTKLYHELLEKNIIDKDFDEVLYAHQSPNNHFTPKISKERFDILKKQVSTEIDEYNTRAIEVWR